MFQQLNAFFSWEIYFLKDKIIIINFSNNTSRIVIMPEI